MRISKKYKRRLNNYLLWRSGDFLRPQVGFSEDSPCAAESMLRWESKGDSRPTVSSEPGLLADYIQGKMSRDWHITEWLEGWNKGLFLAEEFLGVLGMTTEEFVRVFQREPQPETLCLINGLESAEA